MLPLAGSVVPSSHLTLAEAINDGLASRDLRPRQVLVEGGTFPEIDLLRVDLTGAQISRASNLKSAAPTGNSGSEYPQLQVKRIELKADPIHFEKTPLHLQLDATDATLALADNGAGTKLLMLSEAASGRVSVTTHMSDVEKLVHELVADAAAKQGIEIKETRVKTTSLSPRALTFEVELTAKMFIMRAKIVISGKLQVDDDLNAHLSELACGGDGMIANAANALLKPHFQKAQSRAFPLMTLSLGSVKLRDISLSSGSTVHLTATFAS